VDEVRDHMEHDQIQEETLRSIDILLKNGANLNVPGAFLSQLQMHLLYSTARSSWSRTSYTITARLLAHGCDVNAVADDEANITRLHRECAFMRLEEREQEYIDHAVNCWGRSEIYDTSLRFVQNQIQIDTEALSAGLRFPYSKNH
jgi:hypothetical protein